MSIATQLLATGRVTDPCSDGCPDAAASTRLADRDPAASSRTGAGFAGPVLLAAATISAAPAAKAAP